MLILKKINNNVALAASDAGDEVVVFGKGVGFHEMPYELTDESLIQRKFYNVPENLQDMMVSLPDDILLAAGDIACDASQQLGCKLSGALPMILADHLQFAVQRDDDQVYAPNPLEHEVAFIYPRELEAGKRGLDIVEKHTGVRLGDNEATSIALHIVNAEIDGMGRAKDMDFVMKSTRVLDEVTHAVEEQIGHPIDTTSFAYIRFLAHLRYLVRRLVKGACQQTENSSLFMQAARDFPEAYQCAYAINRVFEKELNQSCSDEELLYLMMHINRLRSSAQRE